MAYSEERADRIRKALQGVEGIIEMKMLGGLSGMLGGNTEEAESPLHSH